MRVTAVAMRLLLCVVACGLLCGVAGATVYYWISPGVPPPPGTCTSPPWACEWVAYPAGLRHWEVLQDHDGVGPPPPNNYISMVDGDFGRWYTVNLAAIMRNAVLGGGVYDTYNMAQMGASRAYTTGGMNTGRDLRIGHRDWNGYWRTEVDESWGPFDQQANWRVETGPIYEFQSELGSIPTTPTAWDLSDQSKIAFPEFRLMTQRYRYPPSPCPTSSIRCDEVWVKVWKRDGSWPATTEPSPNALKFFYPTDPLGGNMYRLDTDIPDGSTTNYNRMQLVAWLTTPVGQTGGIRASYAKSDDAWTPGKDTAMYDLDFTNVSTDGNSVAFRGPIVRFTGTGWRAAADPLTTMAYVPRGAASVDDIYVRVWNAP